MSTIELSSLGHGDQEHTKAIARIKEKLDRARAQKTLDFKTRILEPVLTSVRDISAANLTDNFTKRTLDNKLLLQIYRKKDNLFTEK